MIELELDDAALRRELTRMLRELERPTDALRAIGELLTERTRERFRDGAGPDGSAWAPLSDVTLERRRERGVSGDAPGIGESRQLSTRWEYGIIDGGRTLAFGSPLIQSAVFAFGAEQYSFTGGETPWGDIPARDPITPSREAEQDILDTLAEHLAGI